MDKGSKAHQNQFRAAATFARTNITDLANTDGALHLAKLEVIPGQMDTAAAGQGGGTATARNAIINGLRLDLRGLNRAAHAIDQDEPGFADLFPAPDALNPSAVLVAVDITLSRLVIQPADDAATQAAKTARVAKFVAHGCATDFVATMVAERASVEDAKKTELTADDTGVEDTATLDVLVGNGIKETHYLDAIFQIRYAHDPEKLAGWITASHLERTRTAKKKKDDKTPKSPQP